MTGIPGFIVFSDQDGTILDHNTYSFDEALEGIRILKERGVPLVPVSSKAFEEMRDLQMDLGLDGPFIFENGGGIALPSGREDLEGFRIDLLGAGPGELRKHLPLLRSLFPGGIKIPADMGIGEIMKLTGLPERRAALARVRRASLPFITEKNAPPEKLEAVNRALGPVNLMVTRGGRFYHLLSSDTHKGRAALQVRQILCGRDAKTVMVGLGDSENDIPLLKTVDRPFIIRKHDGSVMSASIEGATITEKRGPAGFTEAIRSLWTR
jgi:mannosyl-3-phosphoglycerate phosphatase